jgi:transcriptional regulator with XRE-family HTH domain
MPDRRRSEKEKQINAVVGSNLKWIRRDKGLSQSEIGKLLEVAFQQVQKYEKNVNVISAPKLKIIADFFKVSVDDLLDPNLQAKVRFYKEQHQNQIQNWELDKALEKEEEAKKEAFNELQDRLAGKPHKEDNPWL